MHRTETSIEIEAPPASVWAVLADTASYPAWNPFVQSIEGELRPGEHLRVRLQPPSGRGISLRPKVLVAEPGHELRWLGRLGLPRLFDGEHEFVLTELDGGRRTRFVQAETFRGVLVPFLGRALADTEKGFVAMNEALRDRVHAVMTCGA
jgi:hypothetical protein